MHIYTFTHTYLKIYAYYIYAIDRVVMWMVGSIRGNFFIKIMIQKKMNVKHMVVKTKKLYNVKHMPLHATNYFFLFHDKLFYVPFILPILYDMNVSL